MGIKIGNDNKIIKSTIKDGNDGASHTDVQKANVVGKISINILVAVIGGIILAYILRWLNIE